MSPRATSQPSPNYGYPTTSWHITKKGYVRFALPASMRGKYRINTWLGHLWVWEKHNEPVPEGMQVHHINEDKTDNRIENLEIKNPLEHKRHHNGSELREGIWWKPCRTCGEFKPVTPEYWYYIQRKWPSPSCKMCFIKQTVIDKRVRRVRKRAMGVHWSMVDLAIPEIDKKQENNE